MKNVAEFRWFCYHTLKQVSAEHDINASELNYNPLFIKEGSILTLWDIKQKLVIFSQKLLILFNIFIENISEEPGIF